MWKKVKKFLLKKSADFIGIDIGTGAIKIAEIAWQKNQPILKNFAMKTLPDNVMEEGRIINSTLLIETLGQMLATTHISSKNAIIAVGGRGMFARELIFPEMTREELSEAIKWDLEKYIPYAPNSYYFDFIIVGKGDIETEIKALLVAAPYELVNNMTTVLKSVGLTPVAVDIEPLALYRTFIDAQNSMIIDMGALLSQVIVFQKGSPAVIRNIPIGGQRITELIMQVQELTFQEAEQFKHSQIDFFSLDKTMEYAEVNQQLELLLAEFIRDIRRTAEYYQLQNKSAVIDRIYMTGGGARMNHLVHYISTQLSLPVEMHDPLAKLIIPASFDKTHLQKVAPHLGTAIGLALRGGEE